MKDVLIGRYVLPKDSFPPSHVGNNRSRLNVQVHQLLKNLGIPGYMCAQHNVGGSDPVW